MQRKQKCVWACFAVSQVFAGIGFGQVNSTYNASPFGDWNNGALWSTNPRFPHNGQPNPGDTYNAFVPGGFVTLNQNITVENYTQSGAASLNNQNGAQQHTLTTNQLFNYQGGEIEGRVTINALGGINISGATLKRMDVFNSVNIPVITTSAVTTWTGGGVNSTVVTDANGTYFATFNNLAGGHFQAQTDSFFNVQINNAGTFTRSVATGGEVHRAPFNNTSFANINTGSLELARGGVSTGTFNVASGARLYFAGHSLMPGSSVLGNGVVRFSNPSGAGSAADTIVQGNYNVGSTIFDGLLQFSTNGTTGSLQINKATAEPITGTGTINVTGPTVYQVGNFAGDITVSAGGGVNFAIITNPTWSGNAKLNLAGGTSTWTGVFDILQFREGAQFNVLSGATFDVVHAIGNRRITTFTTGGAFSNAGTLKKSGDGGLMIEVPATNTGLVDAQGGTVGFTAGLTQSNPLSEIRLSGGTVAGNLNLFNGLLTGTGLLHGTVQSGATISPGLSAGSIGFQNDLTLLPTGKVKIELGGTTPGTQFDVLQIAAGVTMAGTLDITRINGFEPSAGQSFRFIDAPAGSGVTGAFSSILGREITSTKWLATVYDAFGARLAIALPGDANLDGTVNIADFAILGANFNQPGNWLAGNFNGDANTEIGDFSLLAANFNTTVPAELPRAGSVPEPTAVLLAFISGLLRRRR